MKNIKTKHEFYDVFDLYISTSESIKNKTTISIYNALLNHLKEFEQKKSYKISFSRITLKFYDAFKQYLIQDLGLLNNTVGKYIRVIKSFMNFAVSHGYSENIDFRNFKAYREDTDIVYLTEEELLKIYNQPLVRDNLIIVRDIFCFACFTGLRFSDVSGLKKENIKEDHILLKTEKTRVSLQIPLINYAKEILKKYNYSLPPSISNQKTNEYLKQIANLAGIKEPINKVQYNGTSRVDKIYKKYELITTHTARRTFVTLSLEKGMRPEVVMEITGHKEYSTFKKYIKITDKVKQSEMNRIWSNNSNLKIV